MTAELIVHSSHTSDDTQQLHALVAAWLDTYTGSINTARAFATALGAPPSIRRALPGAPRNPRAADETTWLGWCAATSVDPLAPMPHHITRWLAHTSQCQHTGRISSSTRVHRYRAMHLFLSWCVEYGHTSPVRLPGMNERKRHHVSGNQQARRTRGLPPEAVAALLWAADHDNYPVRTARRDSATPRQRQLRSTALLSVLTGAGLRVSELVSANYRDYWRTPDGGGVLRILGKGGKRADQPLPSWAADAVDAYLTDGRISRTGASLERSTGPNPRGGDVPLLTGDRGQRLSRDTVRDLLIRLACLPSPESPDPEERQHAAVLAQLPRTVDGCPHVHPHQLRHAAAHLVLDQGGNLQDVKELLRHASIATSQIYTASRGNQAAQVAARLQRPGAHP